MELNEFEVFGLAACFKGHCDSVSCCDFRVCCVCVYLAEASGCEDCLVCEYVFDFVFVDDLGSVTGFSFCYEV